jgi:UDP-N-acetylmuramate--alanine ligase
VELKNIKKIYFVGIGGIGMSALARYFLGRGVEVHGYDKTETTLTKSLTAEGMKVHYTDDVSYIPTGLDLVVYTPAIPKDHNELIHLQQSGLPILKRSEVLGIISKGMKCIAVAGTHGKTTTSSILTHILRTAGIDCTAFLGGISLSIGSNFVQGASEWVVIEADEYDRSFLRLQPDYAIILSMDPDHLDIYGDEKSFREGFMLFTRKLKVGGQYFYKSGLEIPLFTGLWGVDASEYWNVGHIESDSFGISKGKYRSKKVRVEDGFFVFDYKSHLEEIKDIKFTLPGVHNVENATAAIAVAQQLGVKGVHIREALANFKGIRRRFEFIIRNEKIVQIDDYAHHPAELKCAIKAARDLYPDKKITGVFQPHLFSRTRDFQDDFAEALDDLDDLLLMDIYPARELPMEGITSDIIFDKMQLKNKIKVTKENLLETLKSREVELVITLGAGDIDTMIQPIAEYLNTI